MMPGVKGVAESERHLDVVKEAASHLKIWKGSIIIFIRFSDLGAEKGWQRAAWR